MVFKKKGRPLGIFKIRGIEGITPRGFKMHKINIRRITFKKK